MSIFKSAGFAALATLIAASFGPAATAQQIVRGASSAPSLLTLTPDQQLDVYKHIEKYFVVKTVRRGSHVAPLTRANTQIAPQVTWQGKAYAIDDFMVAERMTGVLVIKDGKVVMERYALGHKPDERWTSFSVAKSITSTLIGAAIKDGYIKSLDEPVTTYIPELKGGGYDGVNVRQLVTMTSGVKWNEDYTDPKADVTQSSLWKGEPGMDPLVSYMRRLPSEAAPGTLFKYKTGETDLAGILVARATHRGMAQYLSEKIWRPYGMEKDAVWMDDAGGMERGGCCISVTLRDYARLALFINGGGMIHGRSILPDGWLAAATSNELKPPAKGAYGYFWWVRDNGFEAVGIFGQSIRFVPSEHLIVVINGAASHATGKEINAAKAALLTAVEGAVH